MSPPAHSIEKAKGGGRRSSIPVPPTSTKQAEENTHPQGYTEGNQRPPLDLMGNPPQGVMTQPDGFRAELAYVVSTFTKAVGEPGERSGDSVSHPAGEFCCPGRDTPPKMLKIALERSQPPLDRIEIGQYCAAAQELTNHRDLCLPTALRGEPFSREKKGRSRLMPTTPGRLSTGEGGRRPAVDIMRAAANSFRRNQPFFFGSGDQRSAGISVVHLWPGKKVNCHSNLKP